MQYKRPDKNDKNSQGVVLVTVLLLLALMNILITYVFGRLPIHLQLAHHWFSEAQQFEAAEAGLRYGEYELKQCVANNAVRVFNQTWILSSMDYGDYHINISARALPSVFCLLPAHQEGHYYQITAQATPKNARYNTTISLQSTVALPNNTDCKPTQIKRWEGKNAWCQLVTD